MFQPLLISLQFLTRIPIAIQRSPSENELKRATGWFSFVGLLLGLGAVGTYYLAALIFPHSVAVLLMMLFLVLITGGLHEDGLADCADGFGAGRSKKEILEVMRDSRIGTYGALTLTFVLLLKFFLLQELQGWNLFRAVLVAQTLNRWFALPLTLLLPQVRAEGLGSAFSKHIGKLEVTVSGVFAAAIGFVAYEAGFLLFFALGSVGVFLFGLFCYRRIGGISGDCLGAAMQVAEISVYIAAVGLGSVME